MLRSREKKSKLILVRTPGAPIDQSPLLEECPSKATGIFDAKESEGYQLYIPRTNGKLEPEQLLEFFKCNSEQLL
jgi:hypothetical protein